MKRASIFFLMFLLLLSSFAYADDECGIVCKYNKRINELVENEYFISISLTLMILGSAITVVGYLKKILKKIENIEKRTRLK